MLQLSYHPLYTDAIDPLARFPRERYRLVREALEPACQAGLIDIVTSREATFDELAIAHDPAYIAAFIEGRLDAAAIRKIGFRPWTPQFVERTLRIAGGTIMALEAVMAGAPAAGNLAGGTHHAYAAHGEGYCVFNDLAICARLAARRYGVERVLILDLDVHQGNGTAAILADEPTLFTLSVHGERNYPHHKETSDLDVGLPDGAGDEAMLDAIGWQLDRVMMELRPQLILYQGGVDALAEDALGRLAMTHAGLAARDQRVLEVARAWSCPLVVTMGGGYAAPISASVRAHAQLFTALAHLVQRAP